MPQHPRPRHGDPPTPPPLWQRAAAAVSRRPLAAIVATVAVSYWPSLVGGGTFLWDDWAEVVRNPLVLSPDGLWRIWFTHEAADYWPVTYTVFWFAYRVFGAAPLGYHLLNLAIHVGNCWLLVQLLRRLAVPHGLLAALLFAAHPVNIEAVAWMFQLKTTLAAGLSWLAIWFWLDHLDRPRRSAYAASLVACTAAILTKLSAVTTPVMLLGLSLLSVAHAGRRLPLRDLPRLALPLTPHVLVALVLGAVGAWVWRQDPVTAADVIRDDTALERLIGGFHAVFYYVSTTVIPLGLSFIPARFSLDPSRLATYVPPVLVVLLVLLTLTARRTPAESGASPRAIIAAGWAYALLALFPVMGFVNIYFMRYASVADHWQYFALIGELVILVTWVGQLPALERHKPAATALAALSLVVCCGLSMQRAVIFSREEAVWQDAADRNPAAWLAFNALGSIQLDEKRYDEAEENFLKVLAINPRSHEAQNNLGILHTNRGALDRAVACFEEALRLKPNYATAWHNLGVIHAERGDLRQAERHYLQACRNADADRKSELFQTLAQLYDALDEPEKAVFFRRQSAAVRPDQPADRP